MLASEKECGGDDEEPHHLPISWKNLHRMHCMTIFGPSGAMTLRFTILPRHFSQVVFQSISMDSAVIMASVSSFVD